MMASDPSWLLLIVSLPTAGATARMRIWRACKALGCAALRDGAYLLPAAAHHEQALRRLADECTAQGGSAWLMSARSRTADEASTFVRMFDRSAAYAELRKTFKDANRGLGALGAVELARLQRRLQREVDALRAIDFFAGEAGAEAESAWTDLGRRIAGLLAPDEPRAARRRARRLAAADYQGRTWATRRHLWVDRVASAWLISRFIDRDARFRWLARPSDCPQRALGFDFDGAAFTHAGDRVTFETLMAAFGLESDAALARLAAIVHALDVGGEPVAEASGFEAVMAGARARLGDDDDALLAEMSGVLDSLYAHFVRESAGGGARGGRR